MARWALKATPEQVWQKYQELGSRLETAKALKISNSLVTQKLAKYKKTHESPNSKPEIPSGVESTPDIHNPVVSASETKSEGANQIISVDAAPVKSEAVEMQKAYSSALPINSETGSLIGDDTKIETPAQQPVTTPVDLGGISLLITGSYQAYFSKQGYSDLTTAEREGIEKAVNGAGDKYLPEVMKKHAPAINALTSIIAPVAKREIFEGHKLDKLRKKKVEAPKPDVDSKQLEEKTQFQKDLEAAQARYREAATKGAV